MTVQKGLSISREPRGQPRSWLELVHRSTSPSISRLFLSPHCRGIDSRVCSKTLQSCPSLCDCFDLVLLCDPMDCSLPGFSVHGILRQEYWSGLEENIGRILSDINHSRILYDPPPRVMEIKAKINKWDLTKLKSFCAMKKTISKVKRQPSEWDKIIANEATDKELISKIYKELLQLNSRKH